MSVEGLAAHHAQALWEALCAEFDGFPDTEMRLTTTEAMRAYKAWRDSPDVAEILARTAPKNVTVCMTCGGSGVHVFDGDR